MQLVMNMLSLTDLLSNILFKILLHQDSSLPERDKIVEGCIAIAF